MCLGIPGKVEHWIDRAGDSACAKVEFGGVCRVCYMACVPEVEEGDYVIVHAGIAISRVDAKEAHRIFKELALLEEDDGWKDKTR